MDVPKTLVAPIAKGQEIGTVKVTLDGKVLAQRPLVALNAVEEGGFFKRLWDDLWMWWEACLRDATGSAARTRGRVRRAGGRIRRQRPAELGGTRTPPGVPRPPASGCRRTHPLGQLWRASSVTPAKACTPTTLT